MMIERGNKIYIWNELHFIVVVKYNFRKITNRGDEEIYTILFVKEAQTSYLEWALTKLANTSKNVWTKILLIFYWFLLFFIYAIL